MEKSVETLMAQLAAYEATGLKPEEIESLKTPTAEMLSPAELERAFRIRDRQYMKEDCISMLVNEHGYDEENIPDDLVERTVDLFEDFQSMEVAEIDSWASAISTVLMADSMERLEKCYEKLVKGHIEGILEELEKERNLNHLLYTQRRKLDAAIGALHTGDIEACIGYLGSLNSLDLD